MDIAALLEKIPHYTAFYTVDELAAEGHRLARRYPGIIEHSEIGASRAGSPLWRIKLGNGPKQALCFACPHPNEPIGAMTLITLAELLAEDPTLLAESGMTWHLIPCIDPDGTRLNEGWFKGPFNLENYVRHFYRPAGPDQVEWTFPLCYKGHTWDKPLPETAHLMALIEDLKPSFVFSLHNCAFGGAYWYLGRDIPALSPLLEGAAARQGVPLHLGEPESPYITKFSKAVHSMMSMKTYYDWMDACGQGIAPGPMGCGTCSADFIGTVCDALTLMAELPYFFVRGVDDDSPADMSRREALETRDARRRETYAFLGRQWASIRPLFGEDNPFPGLVDGTMAYMADARPTPEGPDFDRPATKAEVFDCLYISRIFEALDLGLALRACDHALEHQCLSDADIAALNTAKVEVDALLVRQCRALEAGCPYTVGDIRKLVAVQLESALHAIAFC